VLFGGDDEKKNNGQDEDHTGSKDLGEGDG